MRYDCTDPHARDIPAPTQSDRECYYFHMYRDHNIVGMPSFWKICNRPDGAQCPEGATCPILRGVRR